MSLVSWSPLLVALGFLRLSECVLSLLVVGSWESLGFLVAFIGCTGFPFA